MKISKIAKFLKHFNIKKDDLRDLTDWTNFWKIVIFVILSGQYVTILK